MTTLVAMLAACGGDDGNGQTAASGVSDSALAFNATAYTTINVTVDGQSMPVRWYKEVCYVAKPTLLAGTQTNFGMAAPIANTKCGVQSMNIFVPESVANDQSTAIYFGVNNSGWFFSYIKASVTDGATFDSTVSNVGAALKAGYVYIDVATRGRGVTAADGTFPGKAPAAVVDAKAAVRYLRLNDAVMPGNANHIVVNGTSGGGGLSSILGSSGNSADYLPYLATVGAAGIDANGNSTLRDDVLAINAYCPITDLDDADAIYEWTFNTLGTRVTVNQNTNPPASLALTALFPTYEQSLGLKDSTGAALTANNAMAELTVQLTKSAQNYLNYGYYIPNLGEAMHYTVGGMGPGATASEGSYTNDWISVDNAAHKVLSINIERYLAFLATQNPLKGAPAFDAVGITEAGNTNAEGTLFGTSTQAYSNFTAYGWTANDVHGDGIGLDDTSETWATYVALPTTPVLSQATLINPMRYIGKTAGIAPYWYVRAGSRDRDTSPFISLNLSKALLGDSKVLDVNYRMAWDQPHAGNYDVPEAMQWIAEVLKKASLSGL